MASDSTENTNKPFANKIIIFGGDFRQILPVVKRGNRSSIVNASLKSADFWPKITKFRLIENMRINSATSNQGK